VPPYLLVLVCSAYCARVAAAQPPAKAPKLSEASSACLDCHRQATPGVVASWQASRHALTTPAEALARPKPARRMSVAEAPAKMGHTVVGCYECHGLHTKDHQDSCEHFGYPINVIVSPRDCATCHPVEAREFAGSKHALALDILERNPLYAQMVATTTAGAHAPAGHRVVAGESSANARIEACYSCHGTRVGVAGRQKVETEAGELEVPKLTNWPNMGVGRINPDGSQGSCAGCHTRHSFSIAVARKPQACMSCHMLPDVPAWEVWRASKHGALWAAEGDKWRWDRVPWRVGQDFETPTCAACHNSGLAAPDDDAQSIAPRTHDFGARLWVRLFGLPYAHPQPVHPRTWELRNAEGQPLPTSFDGKPAPTGLIDAAEQNRRRAVMQRVCTACHATSWVQGQFARTDRTIREADAMVRTATDLMQRIWAAKLADPANPFDEEPEHLWTEQWLFYANTLRYGSAMMGADYTSFEYGWWHLNRNVRTLGEWLGLRQRQ